MVYLAMAQHASSPAEASFSGSGSHLPLDIAVPVIVVVVLLKVVISRRSGRPAIGGEILVRCGRGHLFRTYWSPLGSFTAIRLGSARFQHCPVGDHWSLVRPVNEAELTDADRLLAEQNRGRLSP
jgi:hypothetical protein